MGNKSSTDRLQATTKRAAERSGKVAVSARYKRLPKKLEDDYIMDVLGTGESVVLGTGYNGSVFMAKSKTSKHKYAVKGFHLNGVSGEKMQQLEAECEIFLSMDHPHVSRLVDVYESESQLHLVMECMEGGELFERLSQRKRFSEKDSANAVYQMLLAINYIHAKGIVHRDLKLENFLYESSDTDHLKLIDFGFSHIWEPNTKMALSCGTLAYVAPEVLKKSYTSKCDLWSLGVILFILLAGYMPFSGAEKMQRKAIEDGNYSWRADRWKSVSAEAIELVKKLLQKDTSLRLSAEEALAHPFLQKRFSVEDQTCPTELIDQSAADALVNFAKASQFRRACMSVMAWSLSNEERAQVRDMFIAMDKDKTGTIKMCELKEILTSKFSICDTQIKPIFDALDSSQNDEIHYTEFLAAMVSTRIAMHDDLLTQTFKRFDCDNSGYITVDNLRTVLGESFNGTEVENLIAEGDLTKDGRISYEEFIAYLKGGDGSDTMNEAAAKIVDTQLKQPEEERAAPALGTLAWAKGKAGGLLPFSTKFSTSSQLETDCRAMESMQVNTSGTMQSPGAAPGASDATPLVSGDAPPADKKKEQLLCLAVS